MNHQSCYSIALSKIEGVGALLYKTLVDHFGSAQAVFQASITELQQVTHIGPGLANKIHTTSLLEAASVLLEKATQKGIKVIPYEAKSYPHRLKEIYNPPPLLYLRSAPTLNHERIVAIVGSRKPTPYGLALVKQLVSQLAGNQVTIVSGLAYGIDIAAHQAALAHELSTIGVLGSGLDMLYPPLHSKIAKKMERKGGILSEYGLGIGPQPHHFPMRNRIIAGLSDAVIIVEAGLKSGALITAQYANAFGREVFAFPGSTTSPQSRGCHQLIKKHQAHLMTDGSDLAYLMDWASIDQGAQKEEKVKYANLTPAGRCIVDQLATFNEPVDDNTLICLTNLSPNALATELLQLSMHNIVDLLPGNRYQLRHFL